MVSYIDILQWISFWKNSVDFWHRKLTLKVQFLHFLMNHKSLQDCFKIISFEYVDSWAKNFLDLYPSFENSTARIAIIYTLKLIFLNIAGLLSRPYYVSWKITSGLLFYLMKVCNFFCKIIIVGLLDICRLFMQILQIIHQADKTRLTMIQKIKMHVYASTYYLFLVWSAKIRIWGEGLFLL